MADDNRLYYKTWIAIVATWGSLFFILRIGEHFIRQDLNQIHRDLVSLKESLKESKPIPLVWDDGTVTPDMPIIERNLDETDVLNFTNMNWTHLYELPIKTLYLIRGMTPGNEVNNVGQLKGLRRGNIQNKCKRSLFTKYDINPTAWFNFVDFNDEQYKLVNRPLYLDFNPKSEVYGVNIYQFGNEYGGSHAGERFVFLGTYEDVVMKGILTEPLASAGVLPYQSKFWSGTGCRNWKSGRNKNPKKDKGWLGTSDYRYNYRRVEYVTCDNEEYFLCLSVE